MNRNERIACAEDTLKALEQGFYMNRKNEKIAIDDVLKKAIEGSILFRPNEFENLLSTRDKWIAQNDPFPTTEYELRNETSLDAIGRLVNDNTKKLCLNFASAKNPGGGFLGGAQAQEESLSRASGLYPCLTPFTEMYQYNRGLDTCLYSDYMIYSPNVPVFKDDEGQYWDNPLLCSFITSPAVNAGVVLDREPKNKKAIQPTLLDRLEKILTVAVLHQYETLILGAWGCGVFRNDPTEIAHCFDYHLHENPVFRNRFKKIVFAVYDTSSHQTIYKAFSKMNVFR